jgi:hypothetical protein
MEAQSEVASAVGITAQVVPSAPMGVASVVEATEVAIAEADTRAVQG